MTCFESPASYRHRPGSVGVNRTTREFPCANERSSSLLPVGEVKDAVSGAVPAKRSSCCWNVKAFAEAGAGAEEAVRAFACTAPALSRNAAQSSEVSLDVMQGSVPFRSEGREQRVNLS